MNKVDYSKILWDSKLKPKLVIEPFLYGLRSFPDRTTYDLDYRQNGIFYRKDTNFRFACEIYGDLACMRYKYQLPYYWALKVSKFKHPPNPLILLEEDKSLEVLIKVCHYFASGEKDLFILFDKICLEVFSPLVALPTILKEFVDNEKNSITNYHSDWFNSIHSDI